MNFFKKPPFTYHLEVIQHGIASESNDLVLNPGSSFEGIVKFSYNSELITIDESKLVCHIVLKGLEKAFEGMSHFRTKSYLLEEFYVNKNKLETPKRYQSQDGIITFVEWKFTIELPFNLQPSTILFDNIAGVYYFMVAGVDFPSDVYDEFAKVMKFKKKDRNENFRIFSSPEYIIVDGLHIKKKESLIETPQIAFLQRKELNWEPFQENDERLQLSTELYARIPSQNAYIGGLFRIFLGPNVEDEFKSVQLELVESIQVETPFFKNSFEKEILADRSWNSNISEYDHNELVIDFRIPSWRNNREINPSLNLKYTQVEHLVEITITRFKGIPIRLSCPITLWPKIIDVTQQKQDE